jgi:hypothetical protein
VRYPARVWTTLGLLARLSVPVDGAAAAVTLEWPTVAGCPTAAEVEAATLRLVAGGAPQPVHATATLIPGAQAWTLRLAVRDAGGAQLRVLSSPSCAALGEAAAVILAVAAAPLQVAARLASPQIGGPEPAWPNPAPIDELEVAPGPRRDVPAPTRARPQLGLFVHAGAGLGPSKRFVPGVAAGLAVLWPRVRLEARATYWGRSALRLDDPPDVGADLRLATGGLRACPLLVRGAFAVQLCAGAELGATIVTAVRLPVDHAPRTLWAAGLLAPGARWRPRRWLALGLEVEAVVPLRRREYVVRDAPEPLHRTPPIGVRLLAGIELNFP